MTARGVRTIFGLSLIATVSTLGVSAPRAAEAACNVNELIAIAPPSPLDRNEEIFMETDCSRAAAAAIERLNASLDKESTAKTTVAGIAMGK
jgi:hypothetical protein